MTFFSASSSKLDAVLPLTLKDFDRAYILLRSIDKFFIDLGMLWIVTPDSEFLKIRELVKRHWQHQVIPDSELIPELNTYKRIKSFSPFISGKIFNENITGWYVQQLIKLAIVDKIETDFYLTLDADVICVKPVQFGDLVKEERALTDRFKGKVHDDWYEWCELVLGMSRSGWTHGVTPAVLSKRGTSLLCDYLASTSESYQHRLFTAMLPKKLSIRLDSWRGKLLRKIPWTEYGLYFTFLEATGLYDKYHFHEQSVTVYGGSVWKTRGDFDTWSLESVVLNAEKRFFFTVIQSQLDVSAIEVWEKVRRYLNSTV